MIKGELATAAALFSELIALEPTAASYLKRAALNQRRRDWHGVVADASAALTAASDAATGAANAAADPAVRKALLLRGQARTHMGDCAAAVPDLVAAGPDGATHADRAQRCAAAFTALAAAEARTGGQSPASLSAPLRVELQTALDGIITLQLGTPEHFRTRAELALLRGDFHAVILDTRPVLQANAEDMRALLLRGDAYYMLGEHANAVSHYKQGLRSDPEHRELQRRFKLARTVSKKLEEAEEATQQGRHADAVRKLDEALAADPRPRVLTGQLEEKKCAALTQAPGRAKDAIALCEAVAHRVNTADAWCQLGDAHMAGEDWAAAEKVFGRAAQMDQGSQRARQGVHRAQLEVKKASRKDYYKALGVAKTAGKKEIKKAYLKLAKQFHPDMVTGEQEKAEAETRFHSIGEAYEVLIDEEKRGRYDRGEDIEVPQGHPGHRGGGFPFPFGGFGGQGGQGGSFHFNFG